MTRQAAIYKACKQIEKDSWFSCTILTEIDLTLSKEYRKFLKCSFMDNSYIWNQWNTSEADVFINTSSDIQNKRIMTLLLFLEVGLKGVQ